MKVQYLALYLLFINIVAIIICVVDKLKARLNGWRISEKTLFITSFIGGALGMYVAMHIVKHKTQHKSFMIGLPLIGFAQAILLIYILYRLT